MGHGELLLMLNRALAAPRQNARQKPVLFANFGFPDISQEVIMAPLRIAFSDWIGGTHPTVERMLRLLAARREIVRSDFDDADLLIYSDFGERHWDFKGIKVYLTGENMLPDFDQCDLAYSPVEMANDSRAVRFPYYAQALPELGSLVRPADYDASPFLDRKGFACFVASNPRGSVRNRFFRSLHRRKPVVSAGRHFNNTGKPLADKLRLLNDFRFNLAFENTSSPGYVTEKLVEPLLAGSIPIYWGAPDVSRDFNLGCMINVADFVSDKAAIKHILEVDADHQARLALLSTPPFRANQEPACLSDDYLVAPLLALLDAGTKPGARRYRHRTLREHAYSSPLQQRLVSLACRLDGMLWKLGVR
jgi:hypothetical protein